MRAVLLLVVLTVAPGAALADFTGRVVKVADGDTLTVLVNRKQIRVRLDGIDAPERGQAFGKRAQQSLAQLCAAKAAERPADRGHAGLHGDGDGSDLLRRILLAHRAGDLRGVRVGGHHSDRVRA